MLLARQAVFAALALGLLCPDGASAFDARGRKRKGSSSTAAPRRAPRGPAGKAEPATGGPKSPPAAPGVGREEALLARYQRIALEQPGAAFPVQRLAALARERDGSLDRIIAEFSRLGQSPGPSQYAARVTLAGLYVQDNQLELAKATFAEALAMGPEQPRTLTAFAELHKRLGDPAAAAALLKRALPLTREKLDIEQTLRALMALQLDAKDLEGARQTHRRLVREAGGAYFVRAELASELLRRREFGAAEQEYRELVRAVAGDSRTLGPALIDLGRALLKNGKPQEAIEVLNRAEGSVASGSGLHRETLQLLVEAHRASLSLVTLLTRLESTRGDFEALRVIVLLHEELGHLQAAARTARKALRAKPGDVDLRVRLIKLLEVQGELEPALAEHRELIRRAPGNVDFVLRYVESLLRQGRRSEARAALGDLEKRHAGREETLAALVDIYERLGDSAHAKQLLERLAGRPGGDPEHDVELGRRLFRDGDSEGAVTVWRRLLVDAPDPARAHQRLGDLLAEHDFVDEARQEILRALALEPNNLAYKSSLARVLERWATLAKGGEQKLRYRAALQAWQEVLRAKGGGPAQRREALNHVVTLWSFEGPMETRIVALSRKLSGTPPDLISGLLLAEVYVRQNQLDAAQRVLERIVELEPGDAASLERLERVLVRQVKLEMAISVLAKLVRLDAPRARLYYQRMAQYAAQLYQDERALGYAAQAVELSPDDATGHLRLAEMYRRRQKWDQAMAEFRSAIDKDEHLYSAYFQLAELLLAQQRPEEADRFLRGVVRLAQDEELILRSGRQSLELNLAQGTLEKLENELLPLSLARSERTAYRRLLVELYGVLTAPWLQALRGDDPEARAAAKDALGALAQRAIWPLLDALNDSEHGQRGEALRLLTRMRSPSATSALLAFAVGDAEPEHRTQAVIAVGAARTNEAFERLVSLITRQNSVLVEEGDPLQLAAVWALVQLDTPEARRLKLQLVDSSSPTAAVLALIGLGLEPASREQAVVTARLANEQLSPLVRAAAASFFIRHPAPEAAALLRAGSGSRHELLRAASLRALGAVQKVSAADELCAGVLDSSAVVREAAIRALADLEDTVSEDAEKLRARVFAEPSGERLSAAQLLAAVLGPKTTADERLGAIAAHTTSLGAAMIRQIRLEPERVAALAQSLSPGADGRLLAYLNLEASTLSSATRAVAEAATERIAEATTAAFCDAFESPSQSTRAAVGSFLATRGEPAARALVRAALASEAEPVRRAILRALVLKPDDGFLDSLVTTLQGDSSWPMRVEAAAALASLGRASSGSAVLAYEALLTAARADAYALVREAAVAGLLRVDAARAASDAAILLPGEPEPRVRALLGGVTSER